MASLLSAGGQRTAILSYHKIGDPSPGGWDTWFYVPEAIFVQQLEWLRQNGWTVIGIETFLEGMATPEILPERSALLTFDDGYRSMAQVALRCLQRFGYPGVVFVPIDYIGGTNVFDQDNEPEEPMCTWAELAHLERNGISVQSHGVSHRAFSELDAACQKEELLRSKQVLEIRLAKSVEAFAFPYGDDGGDPQLQSELLRSGGYRAAFLYGGGPVDLPVRKPYQLERVPIGPDTDLSAELKNGGTFSEAKDSAE